LTLTSRYDKFNQENMYQTSRFVKKRMTKMVCFFS